eukprot:UC1_evm3s1538
MNSSPSWVPLEAIGADAADSGTVDWPCTDDLGCSLNGKCIIVDRLQPRQAQAQAQHALRLENSGHCLCNSGWTGRRCESLDLLPVNRAHLGFNPMDKNGTNMSSWGGSVQQINGTWHMWAVLLTNHCGIRSYLLNSAVVHAVSTSGNVTGPYALRETVLPPFAHEPDVVLAPSGELVLITVAGNLGGYSPCNQCTNGVTNPSCNTCNNSCHPQTPTLSVADSPQGPWQTRPIGQPIWRGENPSIWITNNATVVGMSRGGRIGAYASNWSNLSSWQQTLPNAGPSQ